MVRGSNPTYASPLLLSRFGRPSNIPAVVLPSGGMAATNRKGVTEYYLKLDITQETKYTGIQRDLRRILRRIVRRSAKRLCCIVDCEGHGKKPARAHPKVPLFEQTLIDWLQRAAWQNDELGTETQHLGCSCLGQPGGIPALVFPSGGMAAGHRKGVTAERLLLLKNNQYCSSIPEHHRILRELT
ncbi:hypothetical protein T265_04389 [Opisthorchis viverrini]|uniref:Uncharacterized protein n=1 Tax=Opisthorchis viverrini TaxID=6198 RepID=A0A074ZN70_OPIVI|nr:hypothetical protein T265_04389 [Opisthorchis viverrini]KER28848.1 hypothetical protein T265_04389 [Opisthorchis viverrini]